MVLYYTHVTELVDMLCQCVYVWTDNIDLLFVEQDINLFFIMAY